MVPPQANVIDIIKSLDHFSDFQKLIDQINASEKNAQVRATLDIYQSLHTYFKNAFETIRTDCPLVDSKSIYYPFGYSDSLTPFVLAKRCRRLIVTGSHPVVNLRSARGTKYFNEAFLNRILESPFFQSVSQVSSLGDCPKDNVKNCIQLGLQTGISLFHGTLFGGDVGPDFLTDQLMGRNPWIKLSVRLIHGMNVSLKTVKFFSIDENGGPKPAEGESGIYDHAFFEFSNGHDNYEVIYLNWTCTDLKPGYGKFLSQLPFGLLMLKHAGPYTQRANFSSQDDHKAMRASILDPAIRNEAYVISDSPISEWNESRGRHVLCKTRDIWNQKKLQQHKKDCPVIKSLVSHFPKEVLDTSAICSSDTSQPSQVEHIGEDSRKLLPGCSYYYAVDHAKYLLSSSDRIDDVFLGEYLETQGSRQRPDSSLLMDGPSVLAQTG